MYLEFGQHGGAAALCSVECWGSSSKPLQIFILKSGKMTGGVASLLTLNLDRFHRHGTGDLINLGSFWFGFEIQSCVKTFLLSFENHSQHVLLPTPKLHYGAIFQPAIPETWQECFYTNLYTVRRPVICKVLKIKIWGVPPACLGSR